MLSIIQHPAKNPKGVGLPRRTREEFVQGIGGRRFHRREHLNASNVRIAALIGSCDDITPSHTGVPVTQPRQDRSAPILRWSFRPRAGPCPGSDASIRPTCGRRGSVTGRPYARERPIPFTSFANILNGASFWPPRSTRLGLVIRVDYHDRPA